MPPHHPNRKGPAGRLRRFGTRRSKGPAAWTGQGVAWLVYDATRDRYHCYWLVGPASDHLIEQTTEPSPAAAVAWATARTSRARIRLADHRTYWAGTDPAPPGFAGTWHPANPPATGRPGRAPGELRPRPTLVPTA